MTKRPVNLKEAVFFVKGMHCASCELLIEKRLLKEKGIKAVEASTAKNRVRIKYSDSLPSLKKLNKKFKRHNYSFFNKEGAKLFKNHKKADNLLAIIGISTLVVLVFLLLNKLGLTALINVNSQSALPAFFVFGLLAGFSTCAALVGGIILSMSKQWSEVYSVKKSSWQRFQPHFLFNLGRIISFTLLGAFLGIIGHSLKFSPSFTALLAIAVSIMMIFLGLQMLGLGFFKKLRFTTPKFITRFVINENNFKGRLMPFVMGFFTFLLPCGFTITTQSLAFISGNPLQASLIMLFFSLGTLPALLLIGASAVKFTQKPHLSNQFLKVAGVVVLFFAIYNINSQLNVLGRKNLSDFFNSGKTTVSEENFFPLIGGKQIIKMNALAFAYEPNRFRVKAGMPVRWEITDKGTSGCTNAVISKELFPGQIDLTQRTTSIKEFTPQKPGKYKFSCWMGMVSGTIEVIGQDGSSGQWAEAVGEEIPSGASGCGGGGDGGCGCGNPGCPYAKQ